MNKVCSRILASLILVLFGSTISAAEPNQPDVLDTLNSSLKKVVFNTEKYNGTVKDKWINSYQFAVENETVIVTFSIDLTTFKYNEKKTRVYEAGTYSIPLNQPAPMSIREGTNGVNVSIICADNNRCIQYVYSDQDSHNDKIFIEQGEKDVYRIDLYLPSDVVQETSAQLRTLFE